jgi:hypothetical protein
VIRQYEQMDACVATINAFSGAYYLTGRRLYRVIEIRSQLRNLILLIK